MVKSKRDQQLDKRIEIKHGLATTALGKKIILKAQNNDTQCNNKDIFELNNSARATGTVL